MAYGLKISNPGSELVIDSDAQGPVCIGRGTYLGATLPTGLGTNNTRIGFTVYRFNHVGPIIPAYDLPEGFHTGVMDVTESAPGVWDVRMVCSDYSSTDIHGIPDNVSGQNVWAFGLATGLSVPTGWGLRLNAADGTLSWDFNRPPLYPRSFHSMPSAINQSVVIPAVSLPVVIGGCTSKVHQEFFFPSGANGTLVQEDLMGVLCRTSGTLVTSQMKRHRYVASTAPDGGEVIEYQWPVNFFVVEGAILP